MNIERLKVSELKKYCTSLNISTKDKKKSDLIEAIYAYERAEIDNAIKSGASFELLKSKIEKLAGEYRSNLHAKITARKDATTDGDHITKEHTRVKVIKNHGYTPVRVMFYYPQREQAIKIQETLKTLYKGIDGEYYAGDDAWDYLTKISGYDLKVILTEMVKNG